MNKNMRECERVARVVLGLLIASLAFWGPANPWYLLGLLLVLSGALGYCPLYRKMGVNKTCDAGSCCCKKDKTE